MDLWLTFNTPIVNARQTSGDPVLTPPSRIRVRTVTTREEAKAAIFDCIEIFRNRSRLQLIRVWLNFNLTPPTLSAGPIFCRGPTLIDLARRATMFPSAQKIRSTIFILSGPSICIDASARTPIALHGKNSLLYPSRKPEARGPERLRDQPSTMHRLVIPSSRILIRVVLAALFAYASIAHADVFKDGDHVMLQLGPYVYHRDNGGDHNNLPLLIGVEWESASRWELGASYFENSFYQPCVYVYVGKRWFLKSADDGAFLRLTGGPLYGYKDEYEDKIPFNYHGLGLAIIPGIGYQYERASVQLVILGTAGLMLTFGYDFWQ